MTSSSARDVRVLLSTFDLDGAAPVYRRIRGPQPLDAWKPLRPGDYQPRGVTPLRDAVALFVADLAATARDEHVTVGVLLDESGSMGGNEASVISGVNEFDAGLAVQRPGADAAAFVSGKDAYRAARAGSAKRSIDD